MRYHYEKPDIYSSKYGRVHFCDHPIYRSCTLYLIGKKGLAVIQQRHYEKEKYTYWTNIDPYLVDDLYLQPGFKEFFDSRAKEPTNGLYPTVTVRQLMWALRMKPLPRERWETYFDRKEI